MKYTSLLSALFVVILASICHPHAAYALFNNAKVILVVVDEDGKPIEGVDAGVGFERNTNWATETTAQRGLTDVNGRFTASGNCNGHIGYGGRKEGYYRSHYEYDFKERDMFGWKPLNLELKIVMRKIINPVPMYARNTKYANLKIPNSGVDIGFDLIEFDWISPYGKGKYPDLIFNFISSIKSKNEYEFLSKVMFNKYNGFIEYREDLNYGSVYKLPRMAPENGYGNEIVIYSRKHLKKNAEVSWSDDHHLIFRTRTVVNNNNKIEKAMYGKIVGGIRLRPQPDGSAFVEFSYYLNPDQTRNLEFNQKHNLFGELPHMEQVNNP